MTAVDLPTRKPDAPAGKPPTGIAGWVRDLAMGIRFAVAGGREGWARTLLTAVGVGLGVALLLGAASVPELMKIRQDRDMARTPSSEIVGPSGDSPPEIDKPSDRSMLYTRAGTVFRGIDVDGVLLRPEGAHPPLPPGVARIPGPGEMVVSPALKDLLASPDGALLRERLPYKIIGTIGDEALLGPSEHRYYAGNADLVYEDTASRILGFGPEKKSGPDLSPLLIVLLIVGCVALLMPVAIFIGTAVRFGGERRDRRLAALRLIGADARMVRRVAAGEALFGALLGLALGAVLFLVGRQFLGRATILDATAFPSDLTPSPGLGAFILVAVPVAAVAVTLFTMRRVVVEPLGVVREGTGRRRRMWWRLPIPVVGLAVLALMNVNDSAAPDTVNAYLVGGGAGLTLLGTVLLLPWLVEAVVRRFKGGPVPWQLATRRLQLSSGSAARAVSGITVAVAGAIALQVLFSATVDDYSKETGQDSTRAQLYVSKTTKDVRASRAIIDALNATPGVRKVVGSLESSASRPGPPGEGEEYVPSVGITVGDCATLREISKARSCRDGDVFLVKDPTGEYDTNDTLNKIAQPGARLLLNGDGEKNEPKGAPRYWTVPKSAQRVDARHDPLGNITESVFATPGALDTTKLEYASANAMVNVDRSDPDALERVRNTAARLDPLLHVSRVESVKYDDRYASIRHGLLIGSVVTMALIAASLLVTTLEQLRERRRLLSVLVAFGTRRGTLAWSVLWQTAIPMVLGMGLALAGGVALGKVLMRMTHKSFADWSVIWPLVGAGAGLILVVTLLSLPPLWRMMRPDGLRTE
ncbi:FtsX-like permease family protein [Streptomyces sp. NPDC003077]|uniref:ABC transporter permease n=1 Tax=Streptomyces sp. NPDC003077 TaxID=3154443 RepID=UPI00339FA0E6